jgi:hypothetical protein
MGLDFAGSKVGGAMRWTSSISNSRWRASARRNSVPPAKHLAGLVVELPEHRVLEPVPQLVARAHGIGEGVKGQQNQVFGGLDLPGEILDDRRIVQVAALGDLSHEPDGFR